MKANMEELWQAHACQKKNRIRQFFETLGENECAHVSVYGLHAAIKIMHPKQVLAHPDLEA
jgi:hypothetical protein